MFQALVRKELREHAPAGGIALAASLILALGYLRFPAESYMGRSGLLRWEFDSVPVPIADGGYLAILLYIAGALALALGGLMSWKEEFQKTWAFLLHRPATRAQVLGAKLLAAAVLMLAAVGVPFLFMALWCAIPGRYPAPWSADYLFPGLAILAGAYALFLGAFLCGLRPARWYATRFAPVFGAGVILAAGLASEARTTVTALLALAVVLSLGAVRSVFLSHPRYRIATAALVAVGIGLGLAVAIGLGVNLFSPWRQPAYDPKQEWHQVVFSPGGEPQIQIYGFSGAQWWTTLDGVRIPGINAYTPTLSMARLAAGRYSRNTSFAGGPRHFSVVPLPPERYRGRWSEIMPRLYSSVQERLIVAYDWKTRRLTGYVGRNGFCSDKAAAQPFDGDVDLLSYGEGEWMLFKAGGTFYEFDLKKHSLSRVLEGRVLASSTLSLGRDPEELQLVFLIDGQILFCNPDGSNPVRLPLPEKIDQQSTFQIGRVNENVYVLLQERNTHAKAPSERRSVYLCRIDRSGAPPWEREVTLPSMNALVPTASRSDSVLAALCPGVNPLTLGSVLGWACLEWKTDDFAVNLSGYQFLPRSVVWTFGIVLLLKLLACGGAAFALLGRRGLSLGSQCGWTLFALLGDVPALLAIWAVVLHETRVPCPSCGAKRTPSSERCPRCSAGWPAPAPRDVDLFAAPAIQSTRP